MTVAESVDLDRESAGADSLEMVRQSFAPIRGAAIPGSILPPGTVLLVRDAASWQAILDRIDAPGAAGLFPDLERESVVLVGAREPAIACDLARARALGGTVEVLVAPGGGAGSACAVVVPGVPERVRLVDLSEAVR